MRHTGTPNEQLEALIRGFLSEPIPRLRDVQPELEELIGDLHYEDGYVAGIASSYVEGGPAVVDQIVVDQTIDERLARAVPASDENRGQIEALKDYRARMLEVARQVSRASDLPLITQDEWLARRRRAAG